MRQTPLWTWSKTAMSFPPGHDRNARSVRYKGDKVATFNHRMDEWHPADDEALTKLCDFLNEQESNNDS